MTTLLVGRKEIVVDAEDLKIIADYYLHVNPNGYVQCTVRGYANRGKNAYLHRIILGVNGKDKEVDHINRNKLDNRKQNLRVVTKSQNMHNVGNPKNYWYNKGKNRFVVEMNIEGKKKTKFFRKEEDAQALAKEWKNAQLPSLLTFPRPTKRK